ncbi:MAG: hypothetical protein QNK37_10860 [Acidobacteriota bacterium]|nr:hypothetical protein [Acidobacteriota bacterium]
MTYAQVTRVARDHFDWYENTIDPRRAMESMIRVSINKHAEFLVISNGVKRIDTTKALAFAHEKYPILAEPILASDIEKDSEEVIDSIDQSETVAPQVVATGKPRRWATRLWRSSAFIVCLLLAFLSKDAVVIAFSTPLTIRKSEIKAFSWRTGEFECTDTIYSPGQIITITDSFTLNLSERSWTGIIVAVDYDGDIPRIKLKTSTFLVTIPVRQMVWEGRAYFPGEDNLDYYVYPGKESRWDFHPPPRINRR